MVAKGRVQNGVVVLDEGIQLPEGVEVTVIAPGEPLPSGGHSVLDIPSFSVGAILRPPTSDDDILGEMLEGRRI